MRPHIINFVLQEFFGSNDINSLPIFPYLADAWYILQSKQSQIQCSYFRAKNKVSHHIEASLSEDGSYVGVFFDKRSNFFKNWNVDVSWPTNYEDFG